VAGDPEWFSQVGQRDKTQQHIGIDKATHQTRPGCAPVGIAGQAKGRPRAWPVEIRENHAQRIGARRDIVVHEAQYLTVSP
jgi:hypothetical protein